MRIRMLLAALALTAGLVPATVSTAAASQSEPCTVHVTGFAITPGVGTPAATLAASENITAAATCTLLTGVTVSGTVSVSAEYLDLATMTWLLTDCPAVQAPLTTVAAAGGVTLVDGLATETCAYQPGDPSLDTLHRAHAILQTTTGFLLESDSQPWFLAGATA